MEKKKGGIKQCFGEFKTFIIRGNVLNMAGGVIVGSAGARGRKSHGEHPSFGRDSRSFEE